MVVNLDPGHVQSGWVDLDLGRPGHRGRPPLIMHDLLTDARYRWEGAHNFVILDPQVVPAHIFAPPAAGTRRPPPGRPADGAGCPMSPRAVADRGRTGRRAFATGTRTRSSTSSTSAPFDDSDGDGVGDFRGLIEKLDYLQELGVTALWLLPFYPSPLRDDGYDISDYRRSTPPTGPCGISGPFLREAHRRGLRVITELVLTHTSDEHPWFRRAQRARPGSSYRDFYVWSDTPERFHEARVIFKDFETSNWTFDSVARAYYWHRFYSHQPSLNYDNPAVRQAMFDVVDFWLDMGVDGLRLDAVPYLFAREGTTCENLPETFDFLRELRAHVDERFDDRMLLAEANQWPEDAVAYMGDGDICQMAFHFPLMPRMFMAARQEDRFPIVDILAETPPTPARLPVGPLPPQPRRADPGDGDRRRARLHVPRLRPGSPGPRQRGHPASPGPLARTTTGP